MTAEVSISPGKAIHSRCRPQACFLTTNHLSCLIAKPKSNSSQHTLLVLCTGAHRLTLKSLGGVFLVNNAVSGDLGTTFQIIFFIVLTSVATAKRYGSSQNSRAMFRHLTENVEA